MRTWRADSSGPQATVDSAPLRAKCALNRVPLSCIYHTTCHFLPHSAVSWLSMSPPTVVWGSSLFCLELGE